MGTFVSYKVTRSYIFNDKHIYTLQIFDDECLDAVNDKLDTNYELAKENGIAQDKLESIRTLLHNYVGVWTT